MINSEKEENKLIDCDECRNNFEDWISNSSVFRYSDAAFRNSYRMTTYYSGGYLSEYAYRINLTNPAKLGTLCLDFEIIRPLNLEKECRAKRLDISKLKNIRTYCRVSAYFKLNEPIYSAGKTIKLPCVKFIHDMQNACLLPLATRKSVIGRNDDDIKFLSEPDALKRLESYLENYLKSVIKNTPFLKTSKNIKLFLSGETLTFPDTQLEKVLDELGEKVTVDGNGIYHGVVPKEIIDAIDKYFN